MVPALYSWYQYIRELLCQVCYQCVGLWPSPRRVTSSAGVTHHGSPKSHGAGHLEVGNELSSSASRQWSCPTSYLLLLVGLLLSRVRRAASFAGLFRLFTH